MEDKDVVVKAGEMGRTHGYHAVGGVFIGLVVWVVSNYLFPLLGLNLELGFWVSLLLGLLISVSFRTAPKN